jgi:hypothetical protein
MKAWTGNHMAAATLMAQHASLGPLPACFPVFMAGLMNVLSKMLPPYSPSRLSKAIKLSRDMIVNQVFAAKQHIDGCLYSSLFPCPSSGDLFLMYLPIPYSHTPGQLSTQPGRTGCNTLIYNIHCHQALVIHGGWRQQILLTLWLAADRAVQPHQAGHQEGKVAILPLQHQLELWSTTPGMVF